MPLHRGLTWGGTAFGGDVVHVNDLSRTLGTAGTCTKRDEKRENFQGFSSMAGIVSGAKAAHRTRSRYTGLVVTSWVFLSEYDAPQK